MIQVLVGKYNAVFDYTAENFAYRAGNTNTLKSKYGYFKRRRLEKQINYKNMEVPPFLYAYRAFIEAFRLQDFKTLKRMCEPRFYEQFKSAVIGIEKRGGKFFVVDEDVKMKYKLIELKLIEGLYINRKQNLPLEEYEINEKDSVAVFTKKYG